MPRGRKQNDLFVSHGGELLKAAELRHYSMHFAALVCRKA